MCTAGQLLEVWMPQTSKPVQTAYSDFKMDVKTIVTVWSIKVPQYLYGNWEPKGNYPRFVQYKCHQNGTANDLRCATGIETLPVPVCQQYCTPGLPQDPHKLAICRRMECALRLLFSKWGVSGMSFSDDECFLLALLTAAPLQQTAQPYLLEASLFNLFPGKSIFCKDWVKWYSVLKDSKQSISIDV